jgi:hypothetical protein
LHLAGIKTRNRKPLESRRRSGAAFGCIGRDESDSGQGALPVRREPDEIIAVGAIAMAQHDKMRRLSALRRKARTG